MKRAWQNIPQKDMCIPTYVVTASSMRGRIEVQSSLLRSNGEAYFFWGNGRCKWVKPKENMIELNGFITAFKPEH